MKDDFTGWYTYSCVYLAAHPAVRQKVARQTLAHYRRVKRLPPSIGQELDVLQAPFAIVRWIAWAADHGLRLRRYATALEHRERTGRWPQWRALGVHENDVTADADPVRHRAILEDATRRAGLPGDRIAPRVSARGV